MTSSAVSVYEDALANGRTLYPRVRIGRPGRARTYWLTIAALRLLNLRYKVTVNGANHIAKGPGILLANHVSALDPVVVVMSTWMRVTAFTKVEVYEKSGAIFFRLMGQIPLRSGDEASTVWAMQMASLAVQYGGKIAVYPEGTRSPDRGKLHRLHRRVLIPVLQANPNIPVHAVTATYLKRPHRRTRVEVNISPALAIDLNSMTADETTELVRDELLRLGGQEYVHKFARDVKENNNPPSTRQG